VLGDPGRVGQRGLVMGRVVQQRKLAGGVGGNRVGLGRVRRQPGQVSSVLWCAPVGGRWRWQMPAVWPALWGQSVQAQQGPAGIGNPQPRE